METLTLVIPCKHDDFIFPCTIKSQIIIEKGNNTSQNRNRGIDKATTSLIAFINSHTSLSKNWEDEVINFFQSHPQVDILGGPQLSSEITLFGQASGYALSSMFGTGKLRYRYSNLNPQKWSQDLTDNGMIRQNTNQDYQLLTTANLICRKRIFDNTKLRFDETLYPGEDIDFLIKANNLGLTINYSLNIIVYNKRRDTLRELFKQIFNYGFVRQKIGTRDLFFFIPTLLVCYLILILFLSKIPLFMYLSLLLFFSIYEAVRHQNSFIYFLLLLEIFPCIHISYGLGFLCSWIESIFLKYKI